MREISSKTFLGKHFCRSSDNGWIYYGDDGFNLKAIDWKGGRLHKIANHAENIGFTDSLAACGDLLIATTFDLDSG